MIGADQTLDLDGTLVDKPADRAQARRRLLELRGREHRLHSAVVLAERGEVVWSHSSTARLLVREFSDAWLDRYLQAIGDDVLESVGAYQLEGLGVQLFETIDGDWFTILGMPLLPLLQALRARGVVTA